MPRQTVSGIFQFRAIEPKLLSVSRVKGKILACLNKERQEATRMMNMTIQTWGDPPHMVSRMQFAGGDIAVSVVPEGTQLEKNKWRWLDKGFNRKVYMKPPPGFIRKTKPRNLQSHGGTIPSSDGIAGQTMFPIHVEARQWSSIINRRMKARLAKNVQKAISEGLIPK